MARQGVAAAYGDLAGRLCAPHGHGAAAGLHPEVEIADGDDEA